MFSLPTQGTPRWIKLIIDKILVLELGHVSRDNVKKFCKNELFLVNNDITKLFQHENIINALFVVNSVKKHYWVYIWFSTELNEYIKDKYVRIRYILIEFINGKHTEEHIVNTLLNFALIFSQKCCNEIRRVKSRRLFHWV